MESEQMWSSVVQERQLSAAVDLDLPRGLSNIDLCRTLLDTMKLERIRSPYFKSMLLLSDV